VEEQEVVKPVSLEPPAENEPAHFASLLNAGTVVLDKYEVVKMLGEGGMGTVYQVRDMNSHIEYALKYLNLQHSSNDTVWRRFDNEARAVGQLDHPNLIKVHKTGLLPNGQPYFLMDLVHGVTLADMLKAKTRLPLEPALKIMIQVAFAMAYAHDNGIVHRDIKPSNIMIGNEQEIADGNVKLVDFGIAKLTGQDTYNQLTLTRTGEIFGSPLYMSPEQCAGIATDHRSDLYSFGCVLYEALTGAPPILADNALSTMIKHQTERPVSLKQASLGITFPGASELIVAKLLEKDPEMRYQSAHELLSDLINLEQHVVAGSSAPEVVLKQSPNRRSPAAASSIAQAWHKVSAPMAVALLLGGFFLGMLTDHALFPNVIRQNGEANKTEPSLASVPLIKGHTFAQQPNESFMSKDVPYFSQNRGINRLFVFPSNSIGDIKRDNEPLQKAETFAQIDNFYPLYFKANEFLYENPEYINKFRSDELFAVELRNCDENLAKLLQGLTSQKFLKILDLQNSNVTDAELSIIDKMNLKSLDLTGARVSGAALAQLGILKNLENLVLTQIEDPKPLVHALQKAHSLKHLSLSRSKLDRSDISEISKIKTLKQLDVTDDMAVNDRTFLHIADIPLTDLDIERCPVTGASIPAFKRMHFLDRLHLSGAGWTDAQMAELQSILGKKCQIDWRSTSSDLKKIRDTYAP
jgi:serine/threonine protein kinase